MKRLFTILLMLVYGFSSSGMSITAHYCMEDLVAWDLTGQGAASCSTCGMEKQGHKGCCHDEKKIIKIDKDQKNAEVYIHLIKAPFTSFTNFYLVAPTDYVSGVITQVRYDHAPAGKLKVPIYLYNCIFRI